MSINLNDSTPAAPAGSANGLWQKDVSGNVSVHLPDTTNAANITSGVLALARGGTAADLSATGGTHQVLKQSSSGAAVTVGQLAESDLSFTNIATNDVSITKHGFAPILPNDATKFLNGVGGYSVPVGTGISKYSTTWTSQTSVTVTHGLSTTDVIVQVFDAGGVLVSPESVTVTSSSVVTLTFGAAFTGSVVVLG